MDRNKQWISCCTIPVIARRYFTAKARQGRNGPIHPSRASQRHANPHWCRPIRHRYFLGLCVLTGLAGAAAGHLIPLDESKLNPTRQPEAEANKQTTPRGDIVRHDTLRPDPFDEEAIHRELQGIFEFRPDMAACLLQLAFLHTMNRACLVNNKHGITDTSKKIDSTSELRSAECNFQTFASVDAHALLMGIVHRNPISYADALTLAVVSAVKFLSRGSIQVPWRCGRVDGEPPFAHVWNDSMFHLPQNSISRLLDENGQDGLEKWLAIFKTMGFSVEEFVALLGIHTVGTITHYAPANAMQWTRDLFHLNNSYYLELTKNVYKPIPYGNHKGILVACGEDAMRSNLVCLALEASLIKDPRTKSFVHRFAKDEKEWHRVLPSALVKLCEYGYGTYDDWHHFDEAIQKKEDQAQANEKPSFLSWIKSSITKIMRTQQQAPRSQLHEYRTVNRDTTL